MKELRTIGADLEPMDEHPPLARLLILLFGRFEEELLGKLHQKHEFSSITAADHQVLRCISPSGSSIVEIARQNGTTKQAMSKAVSSLEKRGFLSKLDHPTDGRAQLTVFSPKGKRLRLEGMKIIGSIENRYCSLISAQELARIKRGLWSLFESYHEGSKSL